MAVLGIGVDVCKVERLAESLARFGERMERRLFTPDELADRRQHKDPLPHLAARFAVKEAFIKAIELENGKALEMKEIELSGNFFGKKNLALHGKARELFLQKGYNQISVSISHTDEYATAVVILYCK